MITPIAMPFILLTICIAIGVWLGSTSLFVEAAKHKGFYLNGGAGGLYALGLFGTPILVGLYVAALPDRAAQPLSMVPATPSINDELPAI